MVLSMTLEAEDFWYDSKAVLSTDIMEILKGFSKYSNKEQFQQKQREEINMVLGGEEKSQV